MRRRGTQADTVTTVQPAPKQAKLIDAARDMSSSAARAWACAWTSAADAHYLFQVKANQPTLLARLKRLPWHRVPVLDRTRDRGHGRVELRTLKAVSVGRFGFPYAAQVIQVTRKRSVGGSPANTRRRRFKTVTVYGITSLTFQQASPARLGDLLRGHWAIEALHHARDPHRPLATLGISLG